MTRASPDGDSAVNSKSRSKSSSPVPSPGSWGGVDRGRSRIRRPSNPFSENSLRRRGYHALHAFDKIFHVEKRWKLVREMGTGAYGVVISALDGISGETVAIKMVTRVFDKVQLAKRALREVTLLRHFANHENITGLIDVDAVSPDFNEIYIFMEPMEADLHQIIRSGQSLTSEHVQYFTYQILRGMKYVHSASVIHRDLKPGNLLVNADCELKICDFGLSRGFESKPNETATHLTEYVATRWYRAPEIMLAFNQYSTAIDVWSIGCILAELLTGRPLFKGKDYVDQLNKILDVLGTPNETVIRRIGSEKAQAYVRSLPLKKGRPFKKLVPSADPQCIDLLNKMLSFDPSTRISVTDALAHPWLANYHDENDEPECPEPFDKWRQIEKLETLDQFREALWKEIEEYRKEVRGIDVEVDYLARGESRKRSVEKREARVVPDSPEALPTELEKKDTVVEEVGTKLELREREDGIGRIASSSTTSDTQPRPGTSADPVMTYARRSSFMGSRQSSTYPSPVVSAHQPLPSYTDGLHREHGTSTGGIAFPTHDRTESYVVPARSRTASMMAGGEPCRLLRTLSTLSVHEPLAASIDGLPGGHGMAGATDVVKYIMGAQTTAADAPPSEMPREFGIDEGDEELEVLEPGKEGNKFLI